MASPPRLRRAVSLVLAAGLLLGGASVAVPAMAAPSAGKAGAAQTVREARVAKRLAERRSEAATRASAKATKQAKVATRAERRAERKAEVARAAQAHAREVAATKRPGSKAAAKAERIAVRKESRAQRAEQRAQVTANTARDARAKADTLAARARTALDAATRAGQQAVTTATTRKGVTRARNAIAATRDMKATYVPAGPLDGNHGRRIVYDKALMTVWLVDANDEIVARYPVVGRWDRPAAGEYTVYSQSPKAVNLHSKVTFDYMTRFAWGTADHAMSIGFHSIPRYYDGSKMHSTKMLGLPVATGGCVRMSRADAKRVYEFAHVGTRVVVLPSA